MLARCVRESVVKINSTESTKTKMESNMELKSIARRAKEKLGSYGSLN